MIQIQQEVPAIKASVQGVGRRQVRKDLAVLFQIAYSGFGDIVVNEHLKGGAQQHQRQKQDRCHDKKTAPEGAFHPLPAPRFYKYLQELL